jgi:hypothetical protein
MSIVFNPPPANALRAHQSGLANFDTGAQLGALLLQSSKACYVGILDQAKVKDANNKNFDDCVKPAGWRFLAGDSYQAAATHVGSVGQTSPILTGFSGEPEVTDQIGHLPELESLTAVQKGAFELRFLRVPWLRFEAFWLRVNGATNSQGDYVVPYTDFAAAQQAGKLEVMTKAYPAADFLAEIRKTKAGTPSAPSGPHGPKNG